MDEEGEERHKCGLRARRLRPQTTENRPPNSLRMIYFVAQKRVEEGLACWLLTAAVRLNRDKDCIALREVLGVVKSHHPAAVGFVVYVKNASIQWQRQISWCRLLSAPHLEGAGIHKAGFPVEIESMEDERFTLCVENSAVRLPCAASAI